MQMVREPDIETPLNADLAELYKTDKAKYEETAKAWTWKYAV